MAKSGKRKYWVGFDLGGTKILAAVFDSKFKIVGRKRRKTKAEAGKERAGVERIIETIELALENAEIGSKDISGIGIGSPGPLDLERGVLLDTPNLGWKNIELKKDLEKHFGVPTVVANDVDAGVFGEYRMGAAKKARCVVGLFPGTGIGGGCVYDGMIMRGKDHSCFEIGHCQVQPDGPLCGCGRYGCLEAVASRLAISAQAAAAAYRGDAPHLASEVGLDLSNIRSGALAASVAAGDKVVEKIVRDAARWLGVGISITVNLFLPDTIVLGGGLVEAMPDLFCEESEKAAKARVLPPFVDSFKVVPAKLGDDATIVGAAAWAQQLITEGRN